MSRKKKQIIAPENPGPAESPAPPGDPFTRWILAGVASIVLVVGGFAAVVALRQRPSEPIRLAPEPVKAAPTAWQYDPETNRHWDPNHRHWHSGRPPAEGHEGMAPTSAPDIPNPEPWQYDPVTNQHYNPDHHHWHAGPPPAEQAAAGSTDATETPDAPSELTAAETPSEAPAEEAPPAP